MHFFAGNNANKSFKEFAIPTEKRNVILTIKENVKLILKRNAISHGRMFNKPIKKTNAMIAMSENARNIGNKAPMGPKSGLTILQPVRVSRRPNAHL